MSCSRARLVAQGFSLGSPCHKIATKREGASAPEVNVQATPNFRLILASASPRRRELLAQAGYAFSVEAADVDELVRTGETPEAYVRRLAEEKAQAVFARYAAQENSGAPSLPATSARVGSNDLRLIVLGADTTVVCDGEI